MSTNTAFSRLLVITLSNIGDLVLTTPVFEALAQHYSGQLIDVVGDRRSIELLAHAPYTGDIFFFDKLGGWRSHSALLRRLRRRRYEVIVDLRTAYLGYLLRARMRLHKPLHRNLAHHAVEEHFAAIAKLLSSSTPPPCRLYLADESEQRAAALVTDLPGSKWLAIAPGANWPGKKWPRDHFRHFLGALTQDFDATIILGAEEDRADANAIVDPRFPHLVAAGETDLATAAALVQRAQAFVGNDSGLGHIAAAMDVPTLTLFGPGDPDRYRPWGRHTRIVTAPQADLAQLEPSVVIAALNQLLVDSSVL